MGRVKTLEERQAKRMKQKQAQREARARISLDQSKPKAPATPAIENQLPQGLVTL